MYSQVPSRQAPGDVQASPKLSEFLRFFACVYCTPGTQSTGRTDMRSRSLRRRYTTARMSYGGGGGRPVSQLTATRAGRTPRNHSLPIRCVGDVLMRSLFLHLPSERCYICLSGNKKPLPPLTKRRRESTPCFHLGLPMINGSVETAALGKARPLLRKARARRLAMCKERHLLRA